MPDPTGANEPLSWSEEVCSHCKGYPQYPACTCTPEVLAKREQRRTFHGMTPSKLPTTREEE